MKSTFSTYNFFTGKTTSAKIYNMSGNELNRFWLPLVFQGKAAPNFFIKADTIEGEFAEFVLELPVSLTGVL